MTQETIRKRNKEKSGTLVRNDTSATEKLCDLQHKLMEKQVTPLYTYHEKRECYGQCNFPFNQNYSILHVYHSTSSCRIRILGNNFTKIIPDCYQTFRVELRQFYISISFTVNSIVILHPQLHGDVLFKVGKL